MSTRDTGQEPHQVVVLCGGVGGAKLALGCARVINRVDNLSIIANTGDDFRHYGLYISPDIDTLVYTLSSRVNPKMGWGRADESWNFMQALAELGGETWFNLGDRDLATHVMRTFMLDQGESLSTITRHLAERMGIRCRILPMSDQFIRTRVHTPLGWLDFQRYFVQARCEPPVDQVDFVGCEEARPTGELIELLQSPSLAAILVAPSNPWLSIGPILSVPGLKEAIQGSRAPVVALSPIIAGESVKGPTAKLMRELGHTASAKAIAEHYDGLIDGFVMDEQDHTLSDDIRIPVRCIDTYMRSLADREQVARTMLEFARELRRAET